jgi:hypothetical protein
MNLQVDDQFQHRLIDHLRIKPLSHGVFGSGDPIKDDLIKLLGSHARMSSYHDWRDGLFAPGKHALHVASQ